MSQPLSGDEMSHLEINDHCAKALGWVFNQSSAKRMAGWTPPDGEFLSGRAPPDFSRDPRYGIKLLEFMMHEGWRFGVDKQGRFTAVFIAGRPVRAKSLLRCAGVALVKHVAAQTESSP